MRFMRRASLPSFSTRFTALWLFGFFSEQVRVTQNSRERIVQFVRDAGDELAESG